MVRAVAFIGPDLPSEFGKGHPKDPVIQLLPGQVLCKGMDALRQIRQKFRLPAQQSIAFRLDLVGMGVEAR